MSLVVSRYGQVDPNSATVGVAKATPIWVSPVSTPTSSFARQINALGQSGDVAIGISTSGTSANILKGLQAAHDKGLITVGFSGRDGGDMGEFCDLLLVVPSHTTARIQEMHITLGQMLCGALEKRLGLI